MIAGALAFLQGNPLLLKIVKWVAIVGAVLLAMLWWTRRAERVGRTVERLEAMERAVDIKEKTDEIRANRPRTHDAVTERLRRGSV